MNPPFSLAAPGLRLDWSGAGETRWEDLAPGRTDLPRTLPDMPLLGITPRQPGHPYPPGEAFCYRRTARPGQGRLTGRATEGLVLVLISPRHPRGAQALRDWADFVHISHIAAAAVPGYTMITPYEVERDGPRYLHLYELDTDDAETAFQAMTPLVRERLDPDGFRAWAWCPELVIDYVSSYRRVA